MWRGLFTLLRLSISGVASRFSTSLSWLRSAPQAMPENPDNFIRKLVSFLEKPLVTWPVGILGGVLALLFPAATYFCGAALILAFHHHGVVQGKSRVFQAIIFSTLVFGVGYTTHRLNGLIEIKTERNMETLAKYLGNYVSRQLAVTKEAEALKSPAPAPLVRRHIANRATPAPAPPSDDLLARAEEMKSDLCTFMGIWQAKHLNAVSRMGKEKSQGADEATVMRHYDFDDSIINGEMRETYAQTYQDKALTLRGHLIEKIRYTAESAADYTLEQNGRAKQYGMPGTLALARMDMEDVCRDFTDLVDKYKTTLARTTPQP
jgi:hypothetical protein